MAVISTILTILRHKLEQQFHFETPTFKQMFLYKLTAAPAAWDPFINVGTSVCVCACVCPKWLKITFLTCHFPNWGSKKTYQLDMIIYGPLDPGLRLTPDPPLHTTVIMLIKAPFGRERDKPVQTVDDEKIKKKNAADFKSKLHF